MSELSPAPPQPGESATISFMAKSAEVKAAILRELSTQRAAAQSGQVVAGIILTWAVAALGDDLKDRGMGPLSIIDDYGYGLAVGIVGMCLGLTGLLLNRFVPAAEETLFTAPMVDMAVSVQVILAVVVFIWWTVGAFTLTVTHTDDPSQGKITLSYFFGPTGNGCEALPCPVPPL